MSTLIQYWAFYLCHLHPNLNFLHVTKLENYSISWGDKCQNRKTETEREYERYTYSVFRLLFCLNSTKSFSFTRDHPHFSTPPPLGGGWARRPWRDGVTEGLIRPLEKRKYSMCKSVLTNIEYFYNIIFIMTRRQNQYINPSWFIVSSFFLRTY